MKSSLMTKQKPLRFFLQEQRLGETKEKPKHTYIGLVLFTILILIFFKKYFRFFSF